MDLARDASLRPFNTFGLEARARWLARCGTDADIVESLRFAREGGMPVLVLGGGSNLVLARDPPGLVLKVETQGVEAQEIGGGEARVRAAAGEDWPALVDRLLDLGWWGLENLVLIPGTVGAAPIQNIGAYGAEAGDRLEEVETVEVATGRARTFPRAACRLGYRDSVFKHEERDRHVVTAVTFRVSRTPAVRAGYVSLAAELAARGIPDPGPRDVAAAVRHLRTSRLPDPGTMGNAGSFFQNPVVDTAVASGIRAIHPDAPTWPEADGRVKVSAAWLIERCGFKGAVRGAAGVHPRHALVLVNHGGATGAEVLALASEIQAAVRDRFGVALEIEPRVV